MVASGAAFVPGFVSDPVGDTWISSVVADRSRAANLQIRIDVMFMVRSRLRGPIGGIFNRKWTQINANVNSGFHSRPLAFILFRVQARSLATAGLGQFLRFLSRRVGAMLHGLEGKSIYRVLACLRV